MGRIVRIGSLIIVFVAVIICISLSQNAFSHKTCSPTSCIPRCDSSCYYWRCTAAYTEHITTLPHTFDSQGCDTPSSDRMTYLPFTTCGERITSIPRTLTCHKCKRYRRSRSKRCEYELTFW